MQHTVRCEASCILSTTCSCGTTKTSGKSTLWHPRNAHISATSQHCLAAMQHFPVQMPHSFAGRIPSVADRYLFVCALIARPKTGHPAPKCMCQQCIVTRQQILKSFTRAADSHLLSLPPAPCIPQVVPRLVTLPQGSFLLPVIDAAQHRAGCKNTLAIADCRDLESGAAVTSSNSSSGSNGVIDTTAWCVVLRAGVALPQHAEVCLPL